MAIDVLSQDVLVELSKQRHPATVSLYLAAPAGSNGGRVAIAHDTETARTKLRSTLREALGELQQAGIEKSLLSDIESQVRSLESDREFWGTQGASIAVFASPERVYAYRLMSRLPSSFAAGDRFDLGPLLRATTFPHDGYVLAVTAGDVRLLFLDADASSHRIPLSTLPADAANVLEPMKHGGGRADRHRADGTLGPKAEQRSYCSAVQDAVRAEIDDDSRPLVLAASDDLEPAYLAVNKYEHLLPTTIDANPASLDDADLTARGRAVLDEHYAQRLETWRDRFETQRSAERASGEYDRIAKAAVAGQVESLVYDFEERGEGLIDEFGKVTLSAEPSANTYSIVVALAALVLQHGGEVYAVRRADMPAGTRAAAIFRG